MNYKKRATEVVHKHRKMVATEANTTNVKQTNRTGFDAEDGARRCDEVRTTQKG